MALLVRALRSNGKSQFEDYECHQVGVVKIIVIMEFTVPLNEEEIEIYTK